MAHIFPAAGRLTRALGRRAYREAMRELVYLSERKLASFLPDEPPWWRKLGQRATVEIATPLATVGVGATAAPTPDAARLSRFSAAMAEIERSARWYTEPDLGVGSWVQFEAPMTYAVTAFRLGTGSARAEIVLFLDFGGDTVHDDPPISPRLLLHGSPQHLTETPAVAAEVEIETARPIGSAGPTLMRYMHQFSEDALSGPVLADRSTGLLRRALAALRATGQVHPALAEWLAGYARITARIGDVVCATPLYVQRIPPPPDQG
jgi:hypothetical protein